MVKQNGLHRFLLEEKIKGKGGKGILRLIWSDNFNQWTRKNYEECVRTAENREKWGFIAGNLPSADSTT